MRGAIGFLAIAPIVITGLYACDATPAVEGSTKTPPTQKVLVKVESGLNDHVVVSEFCYDGVVYLINSRGGMAPKINPDRGGQFSLFVSCQ